LRQAGIHFYLQKNKRTDREKKHSHGLYSLSFTEAEAKNKKNKKIKLHQICTSSFSFDEAEKRKT
jgi:hypothetical protein